MKIIRRFAVLFLILTSPFLIGQVTVESGKQEKDALVFSSSISTEEGWKIHKEAYRLQLESQKLNSTEIEARLIEYEKQKKAFVEITDNLQNRFLALQQNMAEIDLETMAHKDRIASLKLIAQKQESEAEELLKEVRWLEVHASEQKHREVELLTQARALNEQAMALKLMSEENWIKAENWSGNFTTLFAKSLKYESETKKAHRFVFKVHKNKMININIKGQIDEGSALVIFSSPNNEKKGTLKLENKKHNDPTKFAKVSGSINKTYITDVVGEWHISLLSFDGRGSLEISVIQFDSNN